VSPGDESQGVEYDAVGGDYLRERSLKKTAGPLLLWGLGVGYVISGDFFGWNYGLDAGGFGGLLVATLLMATLYVTLIFAIAEMATMMPVAGGPYAFARQAMGPWGGYLTGLAVTIEYVLAPAVVAIGIAGYVAGMFVTAPSWVAYGVPIVAYVVFVGINLLGSKVSLSLLLAITAVSVVVLLLWAAAMVPHFSMSHLVSDHASSFPAGAAGVIAAMPAAGWFYLAIEGVPLAAEETRDPSRDLPRGMVAAMVSLVAFSMLALFLGPGAAGVEVMQSAENPLPAAAEAVMGRGVVYWLTTVVGLAGLVASFFSIIFAYSRQIFALSRAGYFPRWLSRTNRHHAPYWALILPAGLGYGAILLVDAFRDPKGPATGDLLVQMAVFAALVSYVLMLVSHVVLRRKHPTATRPYRTPGGSLTVWVSLLLSVVALSSTLFYGEAATFAVGGTVVVYGVGIVYFAVYSRHHLVASAPEEEAALVRQAEEEIDG
jgi:ethanolamine permease